MPDFEIPHSLLNQLGLPSTELEALHGWSNEVWLTPTHVVRLSSGRFRESFKHEVAAIQLIRDRVSVPKIVAHGELGTREWMIARRVPGQNLLDAWPALDWQERRRAVLALARELAQLHSIELPAGFANPWQTDAITLPGKARDAYHVQPRYFPVIIKSLRSSGLLEPALLARAEQWLHEQLPLFEHDEDVLLHGDLHFNNLMWDGERITLLDLEGASRGARDVELDTIIRFTCAPAPFYGQARQAQTSSDDYRDVLSTLQEGYPALFAAPGLEARLKVYEAMWYLLQIHHFPAGEPGDPRTSLETLLASG